MNRKRYNGSVLLAAIIISTYVLATGASPNYAPLSPGADGNAVYSAKCAICHGKDGHGTPAWKAKGQPDFTDAKWQASRTDAQISEATKNGKGKYMPAFKGKLPEGDIAAAVARVRAFKPK